MRKLYIFGLVGLAAVLIGLAWADQITLTTYYPAPYGVYKEFTTTSKTSLATNTLGSASGEDPDSKVGIGTEDPAGKLEIEATAPDLIIRRMDNAQLSRILFRNSGGNYLANIYTTGAGSGNLVFRVGPGNNPNPQLLSERLTILNNGNVGIGRTPTTNKLEVAGDASKAAAGDWLANSDVRIKVDISDIENALEVVKRLHPVKFRYTEKYRAEHPSIKDKYYYNFIAQEFQNEFPNSVQEDGEGYLQIDTHNVKPYLVAAVQEMSDVIKEIKEENEKLQQRIDLLERKLKLK